MSYSISTLIQKFITNKLELNPFELFHLKHLSDKEVLADLIATEVKSNPYLDLQEAEGVLPKFSLHILSKRVSVNFPTQYRSCKYAFEYLQRLDDLSLG